MKAHHYPVKLMGCGFVLTAVDHNKQRAWDAIRVGVAEIERIENLISSWKEGSQTNAINNAAGIQPVQVDTELFDLIQRSQKVSELTAGAFDISGTLSRYYWNFNKQENIAPSKEKIKELRELINYRYIELHHNNKTVFLRKSGMKIGFGGIGKGYAAYMAHHVMKNMGVPSGLINASGDLMCWGKPPGDEEWTVNIPNPNNKKQSLIQIEIPYGSVVSSGSSENYTLINGEAYSHIIDPRTGRPVFEIKNVTVTCTNPEFGDAIATAISVLGHEMGINLINKLNGVECIVIDKENKVHYSENMKSPLKNILIA